MNTVESYITKNPYGKDDECAKFTVDNIISQFVLSDTTEDGFQYTFSFWVKSDSEGNVRIHNKDFAATSTWTKYIHTFEADGPNLSVQFTNQGTYYIYHAQLEIGNVATDWTEAPEDIIEEASKYATNYMAYDETNGLQIGNKRDDKWSGFRTRILPDSFDILDENNDTLASYGDDLIELGRKNSFHTQITTESFDVMEGEKVLASYGADTIELGKESQDTVIKLCRGLGKIRYLNVPSTPSEDRIRDSFEISSWFSTVLRGAEHCTVISDYYDGQNFAQDSSLYVNNSQMFLNARRSYNIDPETKVGTWDEATIELLPGMLNASSDAEINMYSGTHTTLTSIFGSINLSTDYGNVNINGRAYGVNKVLWSGASHMHSGQQSTLSAAVSAQPHGVVLAWSAYSGNTVYDYDWYYMFIPKHHIANHANAGIGSGLMASSDGSKIGRKYIYLYDTVVVGNDYNTSTATASSITFNNSYWVLRYVIGV